MLPLLAICAVLLFPYGAGAFQSASLSTDEDVKKILAERIEVRKEAVGIVVGIIDSDGQRIVSRGQTAAKDGRPVDGDTIFEIGSITKVFTSLALALMTEKGDVSLSDPAAKFLPPGVAMPQRNGKAITLEQLSTHTSGLPRLPDNLMTDNPANPYATYTPEKLYKFLAGHQLRRDPGAQAEYSNLGAGLLGHLLARRSGLSYEELIRTRITTPLKMANTGITLTAKQQAAMATGHNQKLEAVSNWDLAALEGAGAIRSDTRDMLRFLTACLDAKSPIATATTMMLPDGKPALGWQRTTRNGTEITWHNGGTGGFRSFVGFRRDNRTAVVILSNTSTPAGVDNIGFHLLDSRIALTKPASQRKEISLEEKVLDRYTGTYQLAPKILLKVVREQRRMFADLTGQNRVEMFPEAETQFFLKVVDAQLTFEPTAEGGKSSQVTLHQAGESNPAKRLSDEDAQRLTAEIDASRKRKIATVDPKLYDGYVGRYQLAPGFILAVTREMEKIFVQATGQPKFEVFPESTTKFFLQVIDAQITFETDAAGKATNLTLHQNGRDMPAARLE
jgi:CubicO group peptidase (beta-lactamase class C family)